MRTSTVSAALAALVLASASPALAVDICGDINDSGSVNTSDALAVLKRGVGQEIGLTCGPPGVPVMTGQAVGFGAGSDGDLREGSVRSLTDNGDGTITDYATGLMWEKKDDLGGIHDWDNEYTWSTGTNNMDGTLATNFLANLNAGGGFAGHTDWRIPNRFELESIQNLGVVGPSTHSEFNQTCVPACSISTCSCTQPAAYWSSTTSAFAPTFAWSVGFSNSAVSVLLKTGPTYARAVRTAPELETTPTCQDPDPPQCMFNDPCTDGTCSLSRAACSTQSDCPLSPDEECCCAGICL